jgi:UDP-N-acetylmuramyl pentapeptide phosphotransferase/UDP-N-acetylglucosamine-1-phosphate transferase
LTGGFCLSTELGALLYFATTAALSGAVVFIVREHALRVGVLDYPNARSSHAMPTPRGAGAGLVPALLAAFAVAQGFAVLDWRLLLALGGVAVTAIVGWLDDRHGLAVRPRLIAHLAAGITLLPLALSATPAPFTPILSALWWILWGVASINVVNFMDGIDGLVGAQVLVFGVHLFLLTPAGSSPSHLGISLAGVAVGFLWWNWAPARIFLGDGGSGALGLTMVLGGLLVLRENDAGLVRVFLPLYPLFLDATVTLLGRAGRRERLTEAHRSHLYQRLANGPLGHATVSSLYAAGALLGLGAARLNGPSGIVAIGAYFLLIPAMGLVLERTARSSLQERSAPRNR